MNIILVISWKVELRQDSWSIGFCDHCGCFEAIRVGDAVQAASLYELLPLSHTVVGEAACCDWCGNPARPDRQARIIPLDKWSPADGITALFEHCAPELGKEIPLRTTDSQLRATLDSITQRSSLNAVGIGIGLIAGMLLGAGLAFAINLVLGFAPGRDSFGSGMVALLTGGVVGTIVGSTVEAVFKGRREARRLVLAAFHKYRLNPAHLTALASSYPARVRNAIQLTLAQNTTG